VNKYAYQIEGHGDWTIIKSRCEPDEITDIAEEAAEYEWDNCDGWEWMAKCWEIVVHIYDAETEALLGSATVRPEATMTFHAYARPAEAGKGGAT